MQFWECVKIWYRFQRIKGYRVDSTEICAAFVDFVGREIQTLERKASLAKIGTYEEVWLQAMKTRLDKLPRSVGYQNSYARRLIS